MPQVTTCGTAGYTSHLAWNNGNLDAHRTWCEYADRYALALICVEILLVGPGTGATGEGGIFDQDEMRSQSGRGIDSTLAELRARYPRAADLLEATIHSRRFSDCPSPQDWSGFAGGQSFTPPTLDDLPRICPNDFADILKRLRHAAPLWPAPSLREMPAPVIRIPGSQVVEDAPARLLIRG